MASTTLDKLIQQFSILEAVVCKILDTNKWSPILKEKLDQLEQVVTELPSDASDLGPRWTSLLANYWTQYSLLKQTSSLSGLVSVPLDHAVQKERIEKDLSLADHSVPWKILITPCKIIVLSNVDGTETKCFEYLINPSDDPRALLNGLNGVALVETLEFVYKNMQNSKLSPTILKGQQVDPSTTKQQAIGFNQTQQPHKSSNETKEATNQKDSSSTLEDTQSFKNVSTIRAGRNRHPSEAPVVRPATSNLSRSASIDGSSNSNVLYYQSSFESSKKNEIWKNIKNNSPGFSGLKKDNSKNVNDPDRQENQEGDDFNRITAKNLSIPSKSFNVTKSLPQKSMAKSGGKIRDSLCSMENTISYGQEVDDFNWSTTKKPVSRVKTSTNVIKNLESTTQSNGRVRDSLYSPPDEAEKSISHGQEDDDFNWSTTKKPVSRVKTSTNVIKNLESKTTTQSNARVRNSLYSPPDEAEKSISHGQEDDDFSWSTPIPPPKTVAMTRKSSNIESKQFEKKKNDSLYSCNDVDDIADFDRSADAPVLSKTSRPKNPMGTHRKDPQESYSAYDTSDTPKRANSQNRKFVNFQNNDSVQFNSQARSWNKIDKLVAPEVSSKKDSIPYSEKNLDIDDFSYCTSAPIPKSPAKTKKSESNHSLRQASQQNQSSKQEQLINIKDVDFFEFKSKNKEFFEGSDSNWSTNALLNVPKKKLAPLEVRVSKVMNSKKEVDSGDVAKGDDFNWSTKMPSKAISKSLSDMPITFKQSNPSSRKSSISSKCDEADDGELMSPSGDRFFNASAVSKGHLMPVATKMLNRSMNTKQPTDHLSRNDTATLDFKSPKKDLTSIRLELKEEFDSLPLTKSASDIAGMRRILLVVSKAIRLLKTFSGEEYFELCEEFFELALSKLCKSTQKLYLEQGECDGESLKHLATFLRAQAPNSGPPTCNYCKQVGHYLSQCTLLETTVCFKCYETGHSNKHCTNSPLINFKH